MRLLTPDSLAQAITDQCDGVGFGLARSYIDHKLASPVAASIRDDVGEGNQGQVCESDIYALEQRLSMQSLTISSMQFEACSGFHTTLAANFLSVIPNAYFHNCVFQTTSIGQFDRASRFNFEGCTFYAPWAQRLPDTPINAPLLFSGCVFEEGIEVSLGGDEFGCGALFGGCEIGQLTLRNLTLNHAKVFDSTADAPSKLRNLRLDNCEIHAKFSLDNVSGIDTVELSNSNFHEKFSMVGCVVRKLQIVNTNFKKLADFYETSFEMFGIEKSIFKDFAGFERCVFGRSDAVGGKVELRYVTFYSFINFRQVHFNLALDLRNTNLAEPANFLDCSFSEFARNGTLRETFRIIKQSFESVGNRIEANSFFAHEMDAYRRELREARRAKQQLIPRTEELLLSLNAWFSCHGQSYGRPLVWLLGTAALFALQQANWPNRWVSMPALLADWLVPVGHFLNAWAKGLVIFQPLYAKYEGQEALILLVAVALSTFTWHLLVAVRRHNRR